MSFSRATLLMMLLCAATGLSRAQQPADLPQAPQPETASLSGSVVDEDGSLVPGARIEIQVAGSIQVEIADGQGDFRIEGLPSGAYTLRVSASGFTTRQEGGSLFTGEQGELPPIELKMVAERTTVNVVASQHEIATAQLAAETKQRVLGVVPNFYVVYYPNPAPLTSGQKFHLAARSTLDPISFLGAGFSAGIEQASGDFSGYGQGAAGYARRYGASFADGAVSTFLGGALLPSIFHQDPRYFYKGTGTTGARLRHAVAAVVVCRGDNGKREFNYSNVIGSFASAGISNAYYPASDRHGAGLTLQNASVGLGFGAFSAIMQEFVVPKLTPHRPGKGGAPVNNGF